MRMVHHAMMSVSVCALSLFACSSSANAHDKHDKHCRDLSGTFSSVTVPNCPDSPVGLCTQGVLDGEIEGDYYFIFESFAPHPSDPTKSTYTGTSVITTDDGIIYTDDTGVIDAVPPEQAADFVTTADIVDGTEDFDKKDGVFVASGVLEFGAAEGTYDATICKDKKDKDKKDKDKKDKDKKDHGRGRR